MNQLVYVSDSSYDANDNLVPETHHRLYMNVFPVLAVCMLVVVLISQILMCYLDPYLHYVPFGELIRSYLYRNLTSALPSLLIV